MVRPALASLLILIACAEPVDEARVTATALADAETIVSEVEVAKDFADNGNFTEAIAAWQRAQGLMDGRFMQALESEHHDRDALKLSFLLGRLRHEIDRDGDLAAVTEQLANTVRHVTREVWGQTFRTEEAMVELAAVP